VSERLDAHVLEFPESGPPMWKVFPVHRSESEARGGQGGDAGDVRRQGPVLAEPGEAFEAVPARNRWRAALGPAQQDLGL
jgi:hypothetical protein